MSESLTKLHCEIDDSTTLQIAHLVNRHLKKTFPASQPFICQKFRENLKTLSVAVQSKLAGFSLKGKPRDLDYPACCGDGMQTAALADCERLRTNRRHAELKKPPQLTERYEFYVVVLITASGSNFTFWSLCHLLLITDRCVIGEHCPLLRCFERV